MVFINIQGMLMQNSVESFVGNIELVDVFLKATNSECFAFPRSIDPSKLDLHYGFDFQFDDLKDSKVLLCFIELSVTAKHQEVEEDQFSISAQYVLAYDYKKFTGQTSKELFESFTKRNALFNAYPFLRETITSLSTKMTLPPVIAPLLRFDKKGDVNLSDEPEIKTKKEPIKKTPAKRKKKV